MSKKTAKKSRQTIVLDYESYFDQSYTLKKLSTSTYIRNPQFKAQCMGILVVGEDKRARVVNGHDGIKRELRKYDWSNVAVLAHHAHFDGLILTHIFNTTPAYWLDTLSMARLIHGSDVRADLDSLARYYGLGGKTPDVLMKTKGVRNLPPELLRELGEYCAKDVDLTWKIYQELYQYVPDDELDLIDSTVRMFAEPVLRVDRERAKAELDREVKAKKKAIRKAGVHIDELHSAPAFAELLRSHGIEPPTKISKRTGKVTYAFSKTDQDFVSLADSEDEDLADLIKARLAAKSTIGETRAQALLDRTARGMRLPAYFAYARAHTLRWGGGDACNLQNLESRGRGELKKCIMAPPGYQLIHVDSAQIEARVNAWLAGQDDVVEAFREGRDLYSEFAETVYHCPVNKTDEPEKRFLGKVVTLASGFQMGAGRLQLTLALGVMGAPVFLSMEECQMLISAYRAKNDRIVQQWWAMQDMLPILAGHRKPMEYRGILGFREGAIDLPNGTTLLYPGMQAHESRKFAGRLEYTYATKNGRTKIFGGLTVENLCQALARAIVADQFRIVSQRYRPVMMVHDSGVFIAEAKKSKQALEFALQCFKTAPTWCADLPLNAEGSASMRYG